MPSPGSRHCANCIGTLSFPMVPLRHPAKWNQISPVRNRKSSAEPGTVFSWQ